MLSTLHVQSKVEDTTTDYVARYLLMWTLFCNCLLQGYRRIVTVDSVAVLDLVCCTAVAQVQTLHEILSSITASETLLQIQQRQSLYDWTKIMPLWISHYKTLHLMSPRSIHSLPTTVVQLQTLPVKPSKHTCMCIHSLTGPPPMPIHLRDLK